MRIQFGVVGEVGEVVCEARRRVLREVRLQERGARHTQ